MAEGRTRGAVLSARTGGRTAERETPAAGKAGAAPDCWDHRPAAYRGRHGPEKGMRWERTDSTVSLSPQITHQGNHTEKTGGKERKWERASGSRQRRLGTKSRTSDSCPWGPQPKT